MVEIRKRRKALAALASLVLAVTVMLVIASCSSISTTGSAVQQGLDPQLERKLENVLNRAVTQDSVKGVIAGVWIPGQGSWTCARGVANIATGSPMSTLDYFRIGSNTKTFVGTVVLQLVEEGKLSLDDNVAQYVPEVPNGENITVRMLLNMTSGLYNYTDDPELSQRFLEDPYQSFTPEELIAIAVNNPENPLFPPGDHFSYCNTNFILLGMIIEKVTGNNVEDEVQNRILAPLNLKHTFFPSSPYLTGTYANGYLWDSESLVDFTHQNVSWVWTAGAMVSTLDDLHNYVEALGEGTLLTSEMQQQRLTMVDSGRPNLEYGLGIARMNGFIGHTGGIVGYNSVMMYEPTNRITILIFVNTYPYKTGDKAASELFQEIGPLVWPEMPRQSNTSEPQEKLPLLQ